MSPAVARKAQKVQQAETRVVAQELSKLFTERGSITPDELVEIAREDHHPLHPYFEWDNTRAAEKWRRLQAYKMIAAWHTLKVVTKGERREYLKDGVIILREALPKRDGSNTFLPRKEALEDKEVRARLVRSFVAELRQWVMRTADIHELETVRTAIEKSLGKDVW